MKQRPAKQAAWENSVKALFFLCGVITVGFVLCISVYLLVSGLPAISQIGFKDFFLGQVWKRLWQSGPSNPLHWGGD